MCDINIEMVNLRKSRASRRTKRSSRRNSRRSKRQRQRGGGSIVLNCTLGADNMVQVTPPEGFTLDTTVANTLSMTPNAAVNNITFAGPGGPVILKHLPGVGPTGIVVEQEGLTFVHSGFSRTLLPSQRKLSVTPAAANSVIKIRNLNTSTLALTASNRSFTITVTTV